MHEFEEPSLQQALVWPDAFHGKDARRSAEADFGMHLRPHVEPRICFNVEIERDDGFDRVEAEQWRQARDELRRRKRGRTVSNWISERIMRILWAREDRRYLLASQQLRERVKEMRCLNSVLRILGEDHASMSILLYDLVRALPDGFQHPDIAVARAAVAGRSAETAGFVRTPWMLKSQVVIANEVAGYVEVGYLEHRPDQHIGPFMVEERDLLQQVAQSLGQAAERYRFRDLQKLRSGQIDRANAALERFAMSASHHLQEPLRAISSYTQLLVRKHIRDGDDSAQEYARYISEAVERMGELIESMSVYATVPRDTETCYRADSQSIINRVLQELELTVKRLDARINVQPMPVLALRPSHVEELFRNLIENALKFRSNHRVDIRIWSELDDEVCSLYVSDNGIGIPSEYIEKIFELYARLHPRERFPGNGVGLSVCRRIVESYGGEIWAMSSEAGTVFTITLSAAHVIQAVPLDSADDAPGSDTYDKARLSHAG